MKPSKESVKKAVESYPELKDYMQEQFPEYFEPKYYMFEEKFEVTTCSAPLFIANAMAKNRGEELRVLLVDPPYEVEVIPNYIGDKTGIKLKLNK